MQTRTQCNRIYGKEEEDWWGIPLFFFPEEICAISVRACGGESLYMPKVERLCGGPHLIT